MMLCQSNHDAHQAETLSGGMVLMGLVFLRFGILFLRVTQDAGRKRANRS
jgi:hypothetical protein